MENKSSDALNKTIPIVSNKEIKQKYEKLESYISQVADKSRQEQYRSKLYSLISNEIFKCDLYYYKELIEEIKGSEASIKRKENIQKIIIELQEVVAHPNLIPKKIELNSKCIKILRNNKVKKYEESDIISQVDAFNKENELEFKKELLENQEHQFIKEQIIKNLQALNYEVESDTTVVDFSSDEDFLLKIPNQSNYLNIRFNKSSEALRYNFLISENKDSLSSELTKKKLLEMEETCTEFKKLLYELEKMGLKVNFDKELPISSDTLTTVPEKIRKRIKQKKVRKKQIISNDTKKLRKN